MATSYKAADTKSQELSCWTPKLTSADRAMLPEKAQAEGRARDLVRNNGFARGAVQSQKDRVIGASYKLQLQPVYKLLGIDSKVAAAWASMVEVAFHAWADDSDCWIDAQRKRTFSQLLREAVATEMVQGECFVVRQWRGSPVGYSTCFATVEPERVCNPDMSGIFGARQDQVLPNGNRLRAGVEIDAWGAAVAYHIRTKHQRDFGGYGGFGGMGDIGQWDRITKTNEFGWRQVIHLFEVEQADQTRGFSSMVSTLQKMKMMDMQEDLELQASQLSTALAFYVKTDFGAQHMKEVIGMDPIEGAQKFTEMCMDAQAAHYGAGGVNLNGVRIPILANGDDIGMVQAHNQPSNHEQFKTGLNLQNARGLGMSHAEYTGDFSGTSYSSARAAVAIAWQAILSKRAIIADKLASQIFRLWFDEAIVRGAIPLPEGVTYWPDNSAEMGKKFSWLTKCNWIGSGRIVIDEFKQAKANETMMGTGQASQQDVLAEQGTDIETLLDSNVRTREMYLERGLPLPEYLGGLPRGTVDPTIAAADQAMAAQQGE